MDPRTHTNRIIRIGIKILSLKRDTILTQCYREGEKKRVSVSPEQAPQKKSNIYIYIKT